MRLVILFHRAQACERCLQQLAPRAHRPLPACLHLQLAQARQQRCQRTHRGNIGHINSGSRHNAAQLAGGHGIRHNRAVHQTVKRLLPGVHQQARRQAKLSALAGIQTPAHLQVCCPRTPPGHHRVINLQPALHYFARSKCQYVSSGAAARKQAQQCGQRVRNFMRAAQGAIRHNKRKVQCLRVVGCVGLKHRRKHRRHGNDVGRQHQHIARIQARQFREGVQQHLAQHLCLPALAVAAMDLHRAVAGIQQRRLRDDRIQPQRLLHACQQRATQAGGLRGHRRKLGRDAGSRQQHLHVMRRARPTCQ